ncbi:unnamed protein product [Effrenium voratum]|uniref:Phytanoyl-CoA dioxygenase n=1 Tax=Effrenium voratum TaxID=2562239 RepID=A0AA36ND87_9DINO|nr:unnamed protein product [Effrenium voratum]CAJ1423737.1 unnamed protein product [Effrenium voratum]
MEGVALEFRRAWHDLLYGKADWRSLGRRAAPLAAAAALGTGFLYVRKQQAPPEGDFLATCTYRCNASDFGGALSKHLPKAQAQIDALQRAARRLRGPIERDLMIAKLKEAQDDAASIMERLLEDWKRAGYFDEPLTAQRPRPAFPGIDLVTQVDESYGRDIGSEVPLCLLKDTRDVSIPRTLSPEDWQAARDALETHGAVVLRDLISSNQVGKLRKHMHLHSSALDLARSKCPPEIAPVREFSAAPFQDEDEDLEPVVSTPGRQHFCLRGRAFEKAVEEAQAGAMPLVWEALCRQRATAGLSQTARPYVSEVQLMVSDPCAVDQFWHVDNASSGLTLVVPLTAIPQEMGATLLLPGSHHLFKQESIPSRVAAFFASLLSANGQPAVVLAAGDALLYDSRLLHRTAANRRYDRTAAVLVFRYDFERPPGMGLAAAQIWSWTGNLLSGVHRFYGKMPGQAKTA